MRDPFDQFSGEFSARMKSAREKAERRENLWGALFLVVFTGFIYCLIQHNIWVGRMETLCREGSQQACNVLMIDKGKIWRW